MIFKINIQFMSYFREEILIFRKIFKFFFFFQPIKFIFFQSFYLKIIAEKFGLILNIKKF
jgi:hypothetical protein